VAQLVEITSPRARAHPAGIEAALAKPLALYVHIPFCVRKCHYCDFATGPAPEAIREQYVDALVEEIRQSPWRGQAARTVFFGGGTPSELSTPQLRRITDALRDIFRFSPSSPSTLNPQPSTPGEWTIECNPGTVSVESMAEMRGMGFNRISLGVQSFDDAHLKALGRIHTAAEAVEAVARAREAGFQRLNLDLIFCLPGQTLAEWQSDVERALALEPEHLSLYNLTIEPETEFGRRHRAGSLSLPDEDLSADMYEWVIDRVAAEGLEQYEVSNFAGRGEECRHNQVYWRNEPYLGFGLSAASYVDGLRWAHTRSMQRYLTTARRECGPERHSEERLEPGPACGEAIMLGLRTRDGVDLAAVCARFGLDAERQYGHVVRQFQEDGLLAADDNRLTLTRRGVMLANAVCAEFLAASDNR
jgi:oxygen-independent coproporphyrinogen-3 oxidase